MDTIDKRKTEKYDANDFTLIATDLLRDVEENKEVLEAIKKGDSAKFNEILKGIIENKLTWGDHIARYIYRKTGMSLEGAELRNYIMQAFEDNGMKQQGSMDPKKSSRLGSQLNRWLESPVSRISRKTCFLFCFGLNMNEEESSQMLRVLRQPDFVPKNYEEAIYYYCLRNNLQFAGVRKWLDVYEMLKVNGVAEEDEGYEPETDTMLLKEDLKYVANLGSESKKRDQEFEEYLKLLIEMPENKKQSETRAKVYAKEYKKVRDFLADRYYVYCLNAGKTGFDAFERYLWEYNTNYVTIPEEIRRLAEEKLISIPALSSSSLEKKIGEERSTEINREDILTIVFLYCVCDEGYLSEGDEYNFAKRKARFIYLANRRLEACGFGAVYLLNPYELFLVSCLLQPMPLEYFLAVWKQYGTKE